MKEITVTELARGLSDFINRATYRREEFLITRSGKPVASLSPAPSGVPVRDLGAVLSTLPTLAESDLSPFEAELSKAREGHNEPVADRWE